MTSSRLRSVAIGSCSAHAETAASPITDHADNAAKTTVLAAPRPSVAAAYRCEFSLRTPVPSLTPERRRQNEQLGRVLTDRRINAGDASGFRWPLREATRTYLWGSEADG